MRFLCYDIQYHQTFTKFYFRAETGDLKINISIPANKDQTYFLNKLYSFDLKPPQNGECTNVANSYYRTNN
ncbi:hypothetical protein ABIB62_002665 [Mucilaginibacter sp. UYP25]